VIVTKPSYSGPCDKYRPLIESHDWPAEIMLAIMQAESGCDSQAIGDDYPINGLHAPSCGLMQVRTLPGRPSCDELRQPERNIETAHNIYKTQGLKAWTAYTNQLFKQFIKE